MKRNRKEQDFRLGLSLGTKPAIFYSNKYKQIYSINIMNKYNKHLPSSLKSKIDFTKINFTVIEAWITSKINEILETHDELLVGMICDYLQTNGRESNAQELQELIEPFLEDETKSFLIDLWELCHLAEKEEDGIPQCLKRMNQNQSKRRNRSECRERKGTKLNNLNNLNKCNKQNEQNEHIEHIEENKTEVKEKKINSNND